MPHTNFYFDRAGDCKHPGQAIAWLQDTRSRTYLTDYYAGTGAAIPRSIDLQNQALLMMGTTSELQTALAQDLNNGLGAVETAGAGSMKIWYVRRKAGWDTKTVVIIASWPAYWGGQATNFGGQGWQDLYPNSYIQAISLNTLARNVIPIGSGKTAQW